MNLPYYTVLLVEDNATDALMVQRAFTKANLLNPLQVVEDGDKAVAYLAGDGPYADRARHPFPLLLLLDLKLPRRSGWKSSNGSNSSRRSNACRWSC